MQRLIDCAAVALLSSDNRGVQCHNISNTNKDSQIEWLPSSMLMSRIRVWVCIGYWQWGCLESPWLTESFQSMYWLTRAPKGGLFSQRRLWLVEDTKVSLWVIPSYRLVNPLFIPKTLKILPDSPVLWYTTKKLKVGGMP